MSRIHEALKRAEEEKAAQALPRGASANVPMADKPVSAKVTLPESVSVAAPALAENPAEPEAVGSNPVLTAELLQQRCARTSWNPDPAYLISFNGNQSVGTEEFRTLRSRLYQLRTTQPLKFVLVTSALAGEGKTFVASNLAQSLVQHRARRVLLIDGDLRKPSLYEVLGTSPAAPGITEYLCGDKDELAVLQRPADNLFFIPGGKPASNAAELIASGQFNRLLERLGPAFDWIIIDSPPWALVSDASVIADSCDGVLLVVRAASTPVEAAKKVREQLRNKRLLGVALNRADERAGYGSYYYHYSGYGGHAAKRESAVGDET